MLNLSLKLGNIIRLANKSKHVKFPKDGIRIKSILYGTNQSLQVIEKRLSKMDYRKRQHRERPIIGEEVCTTKTCVAREWFLILLYPLIYDNR